MVGINPEIERLEQEKNELGEIYRQTVIERNQKVEPLDKKLNKVQDQIRDVNSRINELKPKEDKNQTDRNELNLKNKIKNRHMKN